MNFFILSFTLSLIFTLGLVRYQHLHEKITSDHDLSGPQKFHTQIVPRIGGVGIFFSLLFTSTYTLIFFRLELGSLLIQLLVCALPCFLAGLIEDATKNGSVKARIIATILSAALVGHFLNIWVNDVHIPEINNLLEIGFLSVTLTIIAITGLANAYNIIDGFNGLASMVGIISLFAIGYVSSKVGDPTLAFSCLIVIGAICGFFIWNYPRGLIFLGDGGAYLVGFLIATLSILLVKRNPTVSPWFALMVNAYPIFETLFTIWRRKVHQGKNPGLPDGAHFHSLIYRRLIRWAEVHPTKNTASYAKNARTSPYLWLLSTLGVFPAIIWWNNTWVLQCFGVLFCITYLWLYNAVVKFKTPRIFKKVI